METAKSAGLSDEQSEGSLCGTFWLDFEIPLSFASSVPIVFGLDYRCPNRVSFRASDSLRYATSALLDFG